MTSTTTTETARMDERLPGLFWSAICAIGLWVVAALAAHLMQGVFTSSIAQFGGRLIVIALCGALLGRLDPGLTPERALAFGVLWAALAIGTEIYLTSHGVTGFYELLGSPSVDSDWLRGASVITWLLAPKLAARARA
ncbi:MAG: hypothetical protein HYU52_09315 [Acidobacteria bacterium]|nr:hypothetical protein [Acidobacteriota bacterium]